jgi:hypothetical protein
VRTWLVLSVLAVTTARASSSDEEREAFFEQHIRPLLTERCYSCHSVEKNRRKGGLVLDSRDGWMTGGESGPRAGAGRRRAEPPDPRGALHRPRSQDAAKGRLSEREIADLESWSGWGRPIPVPARSRPPPRPPRRRTDRLGCRASVLVVPSRCGREPARRARRELVPERHRSLRSRRLEANGLAPAAAADRRTLLRRVTFDLIGLPPTGDELGAFLADEAPGAYERVVDRLLASPHYGERWGRAWLDLARYADSNGLDENLAMSEAWRYRDWVVRALNADLPYDRFITQQLAGDLLPAPADRQAGFDQWTATGFLVLGPKMLAEQDKQKLAIDVVDEQLDVTARAFLGLTVGCARCHDHKFDPISTRDYYALAGIFRSTSTMANLDFVSRWRERELATSSELEAYHAQEKALHESELAVTALEQQQDAALRESFVRDFGSYLLAATDACEQSIFLEAEEFSRGNLIADKDKWGTPEVTIARQKDPGLQFAEYDVTVPTPGEYRLQVRYAANESRPMKLVVNGATVASDALAGVTGDWAASAQMWSDAGTITLQPGRNVLRLERDGAVPHLDKLLLVRADRPSPGDPALAPALVRHFADHLVRAARRADPIFGLWRAWTPDADPARLAALELSPLVKTLQDGLAPTSRRELAGRYQTLFTVVERAWRERSARDAKAEKLDDPDQEALRQVLHGDGPLSLSRAERDAFCAPDVLQALAEKRRVRADRRAAMPAPFARALCVADGEPADLPVHIRGSHLNLGPDKVPRRFLELFDGLVPADPIAAGASGRLELARWIANPAHPLTGRVLVNRLWQGHFGRALVRSPSNFGLRGERPTHPELLDWLSRELVRGDWSLKHLHRLMVLSSAYRMSSAAPPGAAERDPENRLLSHMNRRRLEAEQVRDALLAVGGTLDATVGGSLLSTGDGQYVTNDQSADQARYAAPRRSLYLPVIRNAMYDVFSIFDYADASAPLEQRAQSTVAHQALFFMNSPLVRDESRALAARLLASAGDEAARIDRAYGAVLGRPALADESARSVAYLARARGLIASDPEPELAAWQSLCQVLCASNEFSYVD